MPECCSYSLDFSPSDQLNQESTEQEQVESKLSPKEQAERIEKLLKVLKLDEAGLPPEQENWKNYLKQMLISLPSIPLNLGPRIL